MLKKSTTLAAVLASFIGGVVFEDLAHRGDVSPAVIAARIPAARAQCDRDGWPKAQKWACFTNAVTTGEDL